MESFKAAFFQNGLEYPRVYSAIRNAEGQALGQWGCPQSGCKPMGLLSPGLQFPLASFLSKGVLSTSANVSIGRGGF